MAKSRRGRKAKGSSKIPGRRKSTADQYPGAPMGGQGGSQWGAPGNAAGPGGVYQPASGSGNTLKDLPGRMKEPPGGVHGPSYFKPATSQGSDGPLPAERLRDASEGRPVQGYGPGRGRYKT